MNPNMFRKKILNSCLYLLFIHISICFLTQAATGTLSYQLSELKNEEQQLGREHENLILQHSSQSSLTAIYPKIREQQPDSITKNLDLVNKNSFALLP